MTVEIIDLTQQPVLSSGDSITHHFVGVYDGKAYVSENLSTVLNKLSEEGMAIKMREAGVVHLLHNGVIPVSGMVYKNVYILAPGDRLEFNPDDLSKPPQYDLDFPYIHEKSTEQSVPSTRTLLSLLAQSIERRSTKDNAVLMLSSGKDSTGIALALKELGWESDVPAYTYGDNPEECVVAQETCRKLGIPHTSIYLPNDTESIKAAMRHYFENSSHPSCDPTVIPYAIVLYQENLSQRNILDGCGNSMYMGITFTKTDARMLRYYKMLGGGLRSANNLRQRLLPYYSKLNKFMMTGIEFDMVYRHSHFRRKETLKFYPHSYDTQKFWMDLYKSPNMDDQKILYISDQISAYGFFLKCYTAAEHMNSLSVLAWFDKDLIEYYFNLPAVDKFCADRSEGKFLLKQMLAEKMGEEFLKIGKRIFYFDTQKFVLENQSYVREEILNCSLWSASIEQELKKYIEFSASKPRASSAIVDLFLISGWHNHSPYLKKSQSHVG